MTPFYRSFSSRFFCNTFYRLSPVVAAILGFLLLAPTATGQVRELTAVVLVNSSNSVGYNTAAANPGEFQRSAERYLEHLQIPYRLVDVAISGAQDLSSAQLIVSGHRDLDLSVDWQQAIVAAVSSGTGFVNLDSDPNVGSATHMRVIFGATGASVATRTGYAVVVPASVLATGSNPHYIAALQRRFPSDPPGDLRYPFHNNQAGVLDGVVPTILNGSNASVIAKLDSGDPLIVATAYQLGRAVHFGSYDYMRAGRFGFMMGIDDLFWRSLVWAARKPFVLRGYPRLWALQMDDVGDRWETRIPDLYDVTLTGSRLPDGTGGPWKPTLFALINEMSDRASLIAEINAGRVRVSPHSMTIAQGGDFYWNGSSPNTDAQWQSKVNSVLSWMAGAGGNDRIPALSRAVVPHWFDLSDNAGYDMWYSLGQRYVTTVVTPGTPYTTSHKTDAQRMPLRPFRIYEVPPDYGNQDETWPIFFADEVTVHSRAGLPPVKLFAFVTELLGTRYFPDVRWPDGFPVATSVEQIEYYTWRFWSGMAPVELYTHDIHNYASAYDDDRQAVIRQASTWLTSNGVRHVFMDELGDYLYARTKSTLVSAQATPTTITLNYSGNSTNADGNPVATQALIFYGNDEGTWVNVPGFVAGTAVDFSNGTAPRIAVNPTSVQFYAAPGAGNPASQSVSISNSGGGVLNWTASSNAAWLAVTPASGTGNAAISVSSNITGLPIGTYTAAITITVPNAANSPQTLPVTLALDYLPTVNVAPASLNFGAQQVSLTSSQQTVSLSNVGAGTLHISGISVTGDFAQTSDCGTSLAPSASCLIQVTFTPTASGARTGTLTISDNAAGSPQIVSLAGNGIVPPAISNGQPSGTLPLGTAQAVLSIQTDVNSTCKYGTAPDVAYSNLQQSFATTGGTTHTQAIAGLVNGTAYSYYVRCQSATGATNLSDYTIQFSVGAAYGTCPCSVWNASSVPGTTDHSDTNAVELGMKFHADTDGYITGIRFYKGTGNTGVHVGNLWTSSGTQLATATFAGESSSGWQQVTFASPIAISANTVYIVSYHTNVGHYSIDRNFFTSAGVDRPPLHAERSGGISGLNGVYGYGSGGFPTNGYLDTNYWVDVVYVPGAQTVALSAVTVNPGEVIGGTSVTGSVTLSAPAPSGGAVVTLASSNTALATVPSTVTIAAGASSAEFTVQTSAVGASTVVVVSATLGSDSRSASLTINPPALMLIGVSLAPTSVTGGTSSTGTVTLSGAAPSGGVSVNLTSNSPASAAVPATVTVPAGALSANFSVTTAPVASNTAVEISATYNGTRSANLTVMAPSLSTLTRSPTSVTGGVSATGTVTLNAAAPVGGVTVMLSSSVPAAATTPQSVTVMAGATTASFTIVTYPVVTSTATVISGLYAGTTKTASLTVKAPVLSSLSMSPTIIAGGLSATGTVTMSGAAAANLTVTLSSSNSPVAAVPPTVVVLAGQKTTTFAVNTSAVTATITTTISALYAGVTKTATLRVRTPNVASLAISPSTVRGGTQATATVTLEAAPAVNTTVTLTSSNTAAATVPSSITVPAHSTTATFVVNTKVVTAPVSVTISAKKGVTKTANLLVNP